MTAVAEPSRRSLIPWIFVGAMAVVVAVNTVMVVVALRSWTGLTVEKPYERGIAYNRVLDAQHRQDALGWSLTAELRDDGLWLTARTATGQPLAGLALTASLVRPVDVLPEVPVAFQPVNPGVYTATVTPPRYGQWELRVDAVRGKDRFHHTQRVYVK